MIPIVLLLIAVCIVLETIEQICFRIGGRRAKVFVAIGAILNIVGMGVWLIVLRHAPLGQVLPLLSATNITIAIAGRWVFRERVTAKMWAGIILITAGVALVSAFQT